MRAIGPLHPTPFLRRYLTLEEKRTSLREGKEVGRASKTQGDRVMSRVLLLGSGGREHALAWALARSPKLGCLFAPPGNPGIDAVACPALFSSPNLKDSLHSREEELNSILAFCKREQISLVVVGGETFLVAGLADLLEAEGIPVFGPCKAAARIEGSKAFMKTLCTAAGVPTAPYRIFDTLTEAQDFVRTQGAPLVVKADGLAAGKGVVVAQTESEALEAVARCFSGAFGTAGTRVVLESVLEGEEASFFALTDGKDVIPLASARDHKRAYEGDKGPNTGGMGAISPSPAMTPAMTERVMETIITPTLSVLRQQGTPFKGVLYAGLMLTREGPFLIEYNIRFGDPECQVLMMRLKSDLLPLLEATATGHLRDCAPPEWHPESALCVVMATKGYPSSFVKGSCLQGLEEVKQDALLQIFHSGTRRVSDATGTYLIAQGGRVLTATARGAEGDTLPAIRERVYAALAQIDWPEGFYRKDIGEHIKF